MKRVEFFIVGQGLAGLMLAFEMLGKNIDFRIISSPLKSRASIVAAGLINPLVFKRMTKSWMVDELLPDIKQKYQILENILGENFYFEKNILKPLSGQEMELWMERKAEPGFSNYIQSVTTEKKIHQLIDTAGYGIVSGGGYLNMSVFLEAAEQYFRKRNLIIDTDFPYTNINPSNNKFELGYFQAGKIVFCEGHHINKNPFFQSVKLNPVKGEVLLIYAPELSEEYILNKKVFVLPLGNHYFKIGSTYEWSDLTEKTTENGKLSILERFENLISTPYTIKNQWAGIRPTVIDRRPVLGIHPKFRNISVFNGLGTKGVMLAPYFANEMLNVLTISNYSLNFEVQLSRFYS